MSLQRLSLLHPAGIAIGSGGSDADPLAVELAFTRAYRRHRHAPTPERELRCLEVLLPARFLPIQPGDRFVGRIRLPYCGFAPQESGSNGGGGYAFYCNDDAIRRILSTTSRDQDWHAEVGAMLDFWAQETTAFKVRAALPAWVSESVISDSLDAMQVGYGLYRMAGTQLDYAKLLRLGLPGVRAAVEAAFARRDCDQALGTALVGAIDLLATVSKLAASRLRDQGDCADPAEARRMIAALEFIPHRSPESFREAVQLIWLFALASGTLNYGRLDEVLGPFLARDLDCGLLTEEDATELVCSWWRLMDDNAEKWNHRVIVGGRGRENEGSADRFARIAIEASRRVRRVTPQLSLRFHSLQNPDLLTRALDALGEGGTFPILYNDDVNVPAVTHAMGVPEADAVHYLPFGCGEYILWHRSLGTPSGALNVAKCLELALNDGCCLLTGKRLGPGTGEPASLRSFEDVWRAFTEQLDMGIRALARFQRVEYDVGAREASFLYFTLLMDDCLATGRAVAGGVRYLGGTLEAYGNIDAADALVALRRAVFKERIVELPALVDALRRDWKGSEALRQHVLALPKFGNDDPEADEVAEQVHDHLASTIKNRGRQEGLHHYLMVVINNSMNVDLGALTSALPDGRLAGEPLANGINPVAGRDKQGITAFLQSLVRLKASGHAGAVQNMKFSRGMFTRMRAQLEALLHAYWSSGGAQAMLTVVSRGDLEAALREPEKWGHLMVRVGGFSARFVELPRDVQLHVLSRTLHE